MVIPQTLHILSSGTMRVRIISLQIICATMQAHHATRRELQSGHPGFISIDCGIEGGTTYRDDKTNINHVPDLGHVDSGKNMNISEYYRSKTQNFDKLLSTVRSFPEGNNSCYTLKPQRPEGTKYLIRAFFMYGDYDSKNEPPTFLLYLDVNKWGRVNLTDASDIRISEIIHKPKTDYIHICLVNIGHGTPFISALELRELDNKIYETGSNESLLLYARYDCGSTSINDYERYDDDFYDRIWKPSAGDYWENIKAPSYTSGRFSDNEYKPSEKVMSTAVMPKSGDSFLEVYLETDAKEAFYVYMYFLEVNNLDSDHTKRKFNIYLNDARWPPELQTAVVPGVFPKTIYSSYDIHAVDSFLNFSIRKTNDSILAPIQNAVEYYTVQKYPDSPSQNALNSPVFVSLFMFLLSRFWVQRCLFMFLLSRFGYIDEVKS